MRWNVWQANVLKCSGHSDHTFQTSSLVNGLTSDRNEIAVYLGFKHYADLSMTTKMAGSLENVYNFLDELLERGWCNFIANIICFPFFNCIINALITFIILSLNKCIRLKCKLTFYKLNFCCSISSSSSRIRKLK